MRTVSRQGTLRAKSPPGGCRARPTPARSERDPHDRPERRADPDRRSQRGVRDLIENGWDGALVLDRYGNVLFVNRPARELLGTQAERLAGASFGLPGLGRRGVEIEIHRGPGDTRTAEMRVIDGQWEGESARIVLIRDVSPTRRTDHGETVAATVLRRVSDGLCAEGETALDAPEVAARVAACLADLLPDSRAHTYLVTESGDFVRAGRGDEPAARSRFPDRLSALEAEEILVALDGRPSALGRAASRDEPFLSRLAARLDLAWLLVTPLRHAGRTVGLQTVGGLVPSGPSARARAIAEEVSRFAGLAIGAAILGTEAARLERSRLEVLSMVSHELRSPLHVILGYESLLREGALGRLSEEQHDALVRVGRNARHLARLVENTLTAGRVDGEQVPGQALEVRPCDVVQEIREEVSALHEDRDLAVEWEVPEDLPRLCTEPEKLKVVLRNLVVNALKFTDRGSVRVRAERRAGGVAISVVDTGIGIPPDQLGAIFQEFRRAHTGDGRGGVGLGLYIVRRLLATLEGSISVESTPGRGSVFTIWLPLRVGVAHATA